MSDKLNLDELSDLDLDMEVKKVKKGPPKGKERQRLKLEVEDVHDKWTAIFEQMKQVYIGKVDIMQFLMIGLLSNGHILLEGVPGIGKTYIANTFASTLGCDFKRAQFTPDLLPSDVIGTNIFDPKTGTFKLRKGPVFTNILLADEINRAPPKTQSALLEAMAERQVSIEGQTYKLEKPFMVIATQNPVEQEGTYPLPEAQLDRFLMKLLVDLPSPEEEEEIIKLKHYSIHLKVKQVVRPETILKMQEIVQKVYVDESVLTYMRDLVVQTRVDTRLLLGCSPRASIALLNSSKALAAMNGRSYVIPDDVKYVAPHILHHRIMLKPDTELEGYTNMDIVKELIKNTEVPV